MADFDEVKKLFENTTKFRIRGSEEFNRAIDHVVGQLVDSFTLLENGSYGSAVFLSITAMEETAKTTYAISLPYDPETKKKKEHLVNHTEKHNLAISPVFQLGSRLPDTIGAEKVEEMIEWTHTKQLLEIRNKAVYWEPVEENPTFPNDVFDKRFAQELLMFAIESFDDNLVGFSNYSIELSDKTDDLFDKIRQSYILN
ncbi:AbiV family abortive infection protein [Bacteroides fragilis]|uniref:AbiV family abortive infection protein n=1 Tax=Schleiferilactobacillus perolens DSM 12744 TaxID=1423792 RepID=A0A0R1MGI9_9LACO|nr:MULTISPECIES: AbiV family abortive infection protein [Bacteria]KAA4798461.1 AbiV family abortive infection protein [Bacteroides fragilis]KAB3730187.1 AbiV family abortive infection protein [Phocaeicola vulgatus]MZJ75669.1 AbiV family abortive infection protein [Enterobacter hormaechei]MZJ92678.1 AbiV family abortive infection protein [Collinsella aerofaciens]MZR86010.1 AbiV family abortive infection protein [Bifidobacterium longum]